MSKLLEEALNKIAKLPESEQESIASWLLSELESEERWATILSNSEEALGRLADFALTEHAAKRTKELDSDKL